MGTGSATGTSMRVIEFGPVGVRTTAARNVSCLMNRHLDSPGSWCTDCLLTRLTGTYSPIVKMSKEGREYGQKLTWVSCERGVARVD